MTILGILNPEYVNRSDIQILTAILEACKDRSFRISLALYTGPTTKSIDDVFSSKCSKQPCLLEVEKSGRIVREYAGGKAKVHIEAYFKRQTK